MYIERMALVRLAEEASELTQVCMKALRFGVDSFNPKTQISTLNALLEEAGDTMYCIKMLGFDPLDLEQAERRKALSVAKHLQYELPI